MSGSQDSAFRKKRVRIGCLLFGIVLVIAVALLKSNHGQSIELRDGRTVRLTRQEFTAQRVVYEQPHRPVTRRLRQWLPVRLQKMVGLSGPAQTVVVSPPYPTEPLLSFSFSVESKGKVETLPGVMIATRIVAADETGRSFDPVINELGNALVFSVAAFPRRSTHLRIRLMRDDSMQGEFVIPNPAPGPYPQWSANEVPCVSTNADLSVTLSAFTSDPIRKRTHYAFEFGDLGAKDSQWKVVGLEILDATGNHWRHRIDQESHENKVFVTAFGALWSGEDAWKIRVMFGCETGVHRGENRQVEFLAKPTFVSEQPDLGR